MKRKDLWKDYAAPTQMSNKYLLNWTYGISLCVLVCREWKAEENWVSFFISLFWSNGPKGDINLLR